METVLAIILIVFGILQIILFFKIWRMTDDIREIKNKYINSSSNLFVPRLDQSNRSFGDGESVIEIKNGKDLVVMKYDKGINRYICHSNKGIFEGSFSEAELKRK